VFLNSKKYVHLHQRNYPWFFQSFSIIWCYVVCEKSIESNAALCMHPLHNVSFFLFVSTARQLYEPSRKLCRFCKHQYTCENEKSAKRIFDINRMYIFKTPKLKFDNHLQKNLQNYTRKIVLRTRVT